MKNTLVSIVIILKKEDNDFYLWMQIRNEDGPLNGMMEFPGGKIEEGETSQIAAARELWEEVAVKAEPDQMKLFKIYSHQYPDRLVTLYTHLLDFSELDSTNAAFQKNWFKLPLESDIENLKKKTLDANGKILEDLAVYLKHLVDNKVDQYLWMS